MLNHQEKKTVDDSSTWGNNQTYPASDVINSEVFHYLHVRLASSESESESLALYPEKQEPLRFDQ
jgi:hypothetical protein